MSTFLTKICLIIHRLLISSIELSNCRLELYHNNQKINSCQNFEDLNLTRIGSIFQIRFDSDSERYFKLRSVEYKRNICPFLFQNTNLRKNDIVINLSIKQKIFGMKAIFSFLIKSFRLFSKFHFILFLYSVWSPILSLF